MSPRFCYSYCDFVCCCSILTGELPEGWISAVDSNSGRTYYIKTATGETSWDYPVNHPAPVPVQPAAPVPIVTPARMVRNLPGA